MNRIILITGASSGIGEKTALKFAKNKDIVIIHYNSNQEKAHKLQETINNQYKVESMLIKADLTKEFEIKNMIDAIIAKYKKIDIVVNNAGIAIDSTLEDKSVEDFKKVIDINLIGSFLVSKYAANYINKGSIINISSTNGDNSYYEYSIDYDASKAGINILTKDLAIALGPNIRVNAIAPGWVNTNMNNNLSKEFIKQELKKIIVNRFAEPEEIANIVYFLASEEASYINGSIIVADGGRK